MPSGRRPAADLAYAQPPRRGGRAEAGESPVSMTMRVDPERRELADGAAGVGLGLVADEDAPGKGPVDRDVDRRALGVAGGVGHALEVEEPVVAGGDAPAPDDRPRRPRPAAR